MGGTTATLHAWPWQLSLRKLGRHICGATLLNEEWAVTAAHCVDDRNAQPYSVLAGGHQRQNLDGRGKTSRVSQVIVNPGYDGPTRRPDLALLKLKTPVDLSPKVIPVCLPKQGDMVKTAKNCYITGWGRDETQVNDGSDVLRQAEVSIHDPVICQQKNLAINKIQNVCVGGTGSSACNGDSGGPLVCHEDGTWVLRGTASFVTNKKCPTNKVSSYTRMSPNIDWIYSEIGGEGGGDAACPLNRAQSSRDSDDWYDDFEDDDEEDDEDESEEDDNESDIRQITPP